MHPKTSPPPLPSTVLNSTRGVRVGLCAAVIATILCGQFVTKGALYGYSFMGIAFGIIAALKDTFKPTGGSAYLLVAIGALLIIVLMVLLFAGLLIGLALTIYIAVGRQHSATTTRIASFLFAGIAVSMLTGLGLSHLLPSRPDFHGEIHVEAYFFLWPVLFAIQAALYAAVSLNTRKT